MALATPAAVFQQGPRESQLCVCVVCVWVPPGSSLIDSDSHGCRHGTGHRLSKPSPEREQPSGAPFGAWVPSRSHPAGRQGTAVLSPLAAELGPRTALQSCQIELPDKKTGAILIIHPQHLGQQTPEFCGRVDRLSRGDHRSRMPPGRQGLRAQPRLPHAHTVSGRR